MRSEEPARRTMPVSCYGERTVQAPRRAEYRAKNAGRNGAYAVGGDEARAVFASSKGRAAICSNAIEGMSRGAEKSRLVSAVGEAHWSLWFSTFPSLVSLKLGENRLLTPDLTV